MITKLLIPVLLAQSGIHPPLAGYLRTPQGWYELYGVGGNFLTGDRLPEDVVSAAAFDGVRVWKTAGELVVRTGESEQRRPAPMGAAWFAWNGDTVFAWVPGAGELYCWNAEGWKVMGGAAVIGDPLGFAAVDGRLVMLTRSTNELTVTYFPMRGAMMAAGGRKLDGLMPATLDSEGALWTAEGHQLRCASRVWAFDEPIAELGAQGHRWLIVSHGERRSIVRCDSDEVTLLPSP